MPTTRPIRIKSSAIAVHANDTQMDRITAFGSSTRLSPEDLVEIGNLDIVEVIDGIPSVEVTLDQNQYGSLKNVSALARKKFDHGYIFVEPSGAAGTTSVLLNSGTYFYDEKDYVLTVDTAYEFDGDITALSSTAKQVATLSIVSGSQVVVATLGTEQTDGTQAAPATPAGSIKLAEVELQDGVTAITSDYITNRHDSATVEAKDFELANVDFVVPVKETGDNTTSDFITRSMSIKDAYLTRVDFSFSATGESSVAMGLESDNKVWYMNNASNIIVERFTTDGTSTYTLAQTPTTLGDSKLSIRVRLYNRTTGAFTDYVEGTSDDYTISGTTVTLTTVPADGNTLIVRYPASGGAKFFDRMPVVVSGHPHPAGGIRAGQIEVYLSDDESNKVLRLQSVTINTALNREALNEIGSEKAYSRPLQFPIPVTMSVEATASDLEDFARLCGKKTEFDAGTLDELSINDFIKTLDLTVKMYREDDEKRAKLPVTTSAEILTLLVSNVSVTEENGDIRVDSNMTQSFSLKADNWTLTGEV